MKMKNILYLLSDTLMMAFIIIGATAFINSLIWILDRF